LLDSTRETTVTYGITGIVHQSAGKIISMVQK